MKGSCVYKNSWQPHIQLRHTHTHTTRIHPYVRPPFAAAASPLLLSQVSLLGHFFALYIRLVAFCVGFSRLQFVFFHLL